MHAHHPRRRLGQCLPPTDVASIESWPSCARGSRRNRGRTSAAVSRRISPSSIHRLGRAPLRAPSRFLLGDADRRHDCDYRDHGVTSARGSRRSRDAHAVRGRAYEDGSCARRSGTTPRTTCRLHRRESATARQRRTMFGPTTVARVSLFVGRIATSIPRAAAAPVRPDPDRSAALQLSAAGAEPAIRSAGWSPDTSRDIRWTSGDFTTTARFRYVRSVVYVATNGRRADRDEQTQRSARRSWTWRVPCATRQADPPQRRHPDDRRPSARAASRDERERAESREARRSADGRTSPRTLTTHARTFVLRSGRRFRRGSRGTAAIGHRSYPLRQPRRGDGRLSYQFDPARRSRLRSVRRKSRPALGGAVVDDGAYGVMSRFSGSRGGGRHLGRGSERRKHQHTKRC